MAAASSSSSAAKPSPKDVLAKMLKRGGSVLHEAPKKHTATLIFLHGLGDVGSSWAGELRALQKLMPYLKIICPSAPTAPVTLNGGYKMTSWHDIKRLDTLDTTDFVGLPENSADVKALMDGERAAGIPSDRIVLGGFSQGAGMSVFTGYQYEHRLAGIVCLSGYLPHGDDFADKKMSDANKKTPLYAGHGDADAVVMLSKGKRVRDLLTKAGVPVTFSVVKGMGHSASPREMAEVVAFIKRVLPEKAAAAEPKKE